MLFASWATTCGGRVAGAVFAILLCEYFSPHYCELIFDLQFILSKHYRRTFSEWWLFDIDKHVYASICIIMIID